MNFIIKNCLAQHRARESQTGVDEEDGRESSRVQVPWMLLLQAHPVQSVRPAFIVRDLMALYQTDWLTYIDPYT